MQRIKDLHQLQHFPTTLKLLTMCMRPDFLDTLLKEPNGFSKYVKSLTNYSIIRELLPQYGRKDLVTNIFFEQKICVLRLFVNQVVTSLILKLTFLIFLIKPFFLHDQKVVTKT